MANVSSMFDCFDRSYIINLPERRDRLKDMKQELGRLGTSLPCDRVVVFPAIKPADKGKFPSLGARGCFLSHLTILKEARKAGFKTILIMEDDLSFSKKLITHQEILIHELKHLKWDFLYLGHILDVNLKEEITFQEFRRGVRTTHFFAVSGNILDRLIAYLELVMERPPGHPLGGSMHVDASYSMFRNQNPDLITLIAAPSLGFQRSSPSDVSTKGWVDRTPILHQLVNTARKFKTWYKRQSMN